MNRARIFVIEDGDQVRAMLKEMLEEKGYEKIILFFIFFGIIIKI